MDEREAKASLFFCLVKRPGFDKNTNICYNINIKEIQRPRLVLWDKKN